MKLKYVFYTVLCAVLLSCKEAYIPERNYVVVTSHDGNWSGSGKIECDSFTMVSDTEVVLWINGQEVKMFAPMFKFYDRNVYK